MTETYNIELTEDELYFMQAIVMEMALNYAKEVNENSETEELRTAKAMIDSVFQKLSEKVEKYYH